MSWVGFQSRGRAWWSSFRFLSTRAELRHKGSNLLTKLKALMVWAGKESFKEVRLLDKQIRELHSAASVKCVGSERELLQGVTALRWPVSHTHTSKCEGPGNVPQLLEGLPSVQEAMYSIPRIS